MRISTSTSQFGNDPNTLRYIVRGDWFTRSRPKWYFWIVYETRVSEFNDSYKVQPPTPLPSLFKSTRTHVPVCCSSYLDGEDSNREDIGVCTTHPTYKINSRSSYRTTSYFTRITPNHTHPNPHSHLPSPGTRTKSHLDVPLELPTVETTSNVDKVTPPWRDTSGRRGP